MATANGLHRIDSRDTSETCLLEKTDWRDAEGLKIFRYDHLDDNTKQIRLCEVAPNLEHGRLVINIQTYDLDAVDDQFDALSYVCGKSTGDGVQTILNGRRHDIPQNVHKQLCRILNRGWRSKIWADKLSVDSSNEIERCAQVNLMNKIYGGASEVFVGLDDECESASQAKEDHTTIADAFHALAAGNHIGELIVPTHAENSTAASERLARIICRFLLSLRFTTRAWCLQECVLAKKPTILLESGSLPWEIFTAAIESCWEHQERGCCPPIPQQLRRELRDILCQVSNHIANISYIQAKYKSEQGLHIFEVMMCFPELDATYAVDKFNGYRGLHSMVTGPMPSADYSGSVLRFFEKVTIWIIEAWIDLLPLMMGLRGELSAELPSWVPDYGSRLLPNAANYWRRWLHFYQAYQCSTGVDRAPEHIGDRMLLLYGSELETVISVSPVTLELAKSNADHLETIKQWYVFATGRDCGTKDGELFDDPVFVKTMLAGLVVTDQHPFAREAKAADLAQWRHDMAALACSTGDELYNTPLIESHMTAVFGKVLFKTDAGYGIGPRTVKPGDSLWVWNNVRSPVLVRREPTPQSTVPESIWPHYAFLGPCYRHDLSHGFDVQKSNLQQSPCVLI